MHQLRLSILFCTLLSQISLSQSASNEVLSDKLDIVFAGIKPRYYQGESVDITIRIMNPFDHPVALTGCDNNTGCIDLKVFDANNTQLEYKGSSSIGPETEEMQIAGNGEYVFQDNLEVLFFNDTSIPGASEFLPGTYKLVARINGTHSKELEFEILEQKAIDKTVKAKVYNLLYSVSSEDKIENAIVLLDEYPNSIYVSKIYKILLSNMSSTRKCNALKEILQLEHGTIPKLQPANAGRA